MWSFVKAAGTRSAQQLLCMRRQQSRILGHAVDEFDGPDVILLLLLLLDRRRDADPFVAPLSDGETYVKSISHYRVLIRCATAANLQNRRAQRSHCD